MSEKMIKAHVARKSVEAALAQGYTFVAPSRTRGMSTADGKVWHGDAVVMEIPAEVYSRIESERLAGHKLLAERISKGQCPVSTTDLGEGVTGLFEVEEVRDASMAKRRE